MFGVEFDERIRGLADERLTFRGECLNRSSLRQNSFHNDIMLGTIHPTQATKLLFSHLLCWARWKVSLHEKKKLFHEKSYLWIVRHDRLKLKNLSCCCILIKFAAFMFHSIFPSIPAALCATDVQIALLCDFNVPDFWLTCFSSFNAGEGRRCTKNTSECCNVVWKHRRNCFLENTRKTAAAASI